MQTQNEPRMKTIDVKKFSDNLQRNAGEAVADESRLKVRLGNGKYFVVLSADEWERDEETLHVLQDVDLMRQLTRSLEARAKKSAKKRTSASRRGSR